MSYLALYRKYRPLKFEDMVGQEHVTTILKNQIKSDKISHAYIFNGTRGTGKTSAAKIFARAINCLNLKNGEPCNECENCKSILSGDATDVVEMDAASNNSVENIRSVRQEVMYAATNLKYRVYIIDEAHMLSTSAFNALLKTLEEPPKNVIFILATTEEHKILPTILSRCVRFEFKKISEDNICKRLIEVLNKDGVTYEEDAIKHISKLADGGMRDGLSILERCIDEETNSVTMEKVIKTIGSIDKETLERIVKGILTYNVEEVEKLSSEMIQSGKNLRNITTNILNMFLDVLTYVVIKKSDNISEDLKKAIENVSPLRITKVIDRIANLDDEIKQSVTGNIIFKARLLELTVQNNVYNEKELLEKIESLELRIEKLEQEEQATPRVKEVIIEKQEPKEIKENTSTEEANVIKVDAKKEVIEKIEEVAVQKKFKDMAKVVKTAADTDNLRLYSALADVEGFEQDNKIILETKNEFAYKILKKEDVEENLRDIITNVVGSERNIQINLIKEEKKNVNGFESFLSDSGIPFEVID